MVNNAPAAPAAADFPVAGGDSAPGSLFAVTRASAPTRLPTSDVEGTAAPLPADQRSSCDRLGDAAPSARSPRSAVGQVRSGYRAAGSPSAAIPGCDGICDGVLATAAELWEHHTKETSMTQTTTSVGPADQHARRIPLPTGHREPLKVNVFNFMTGAAC